MKKVKAKLNITEKPDPVVVVEPVVINKDESSILKKEGEESITKKNVHFEGEGLVIQEATPKKVDESKDNSVAEVRKVDESVTEVKS